MSELSTGNKSEVARIIHQIGAEYESALQGLSGTALGTSRHSFITTRMENMEKLGGELEKFTGKAATDRVMMNTFDALYDRKPVPAFLIAGTLPTEEQTSC